MAAVFFGSQNVCDQFDLHEAERDEQDLVERLVRMESDPHSSYNQFMVQSFALAYYKALT